MQRGKNLGVNTASYFCRIHTQTLVSVENCDDDDDKIMFVFLRHSPVCLCVRLSVCLSDCLFVYVLYGLFTALHGMQTRSCDENSVRPSVCPSNA